MWGRITKRERERALESTSARRLQSKSRDKGGMAAIFVFGISRSREHRRFLFRSIFSGWWRVARRREKAPSPWGWREGREKRKKREEKLWNGADVFPIRCIGCLRSLKQSSKTWNDNANRAFDRPRNGRTIARTGLFLSVASPSPLFHPIPFVLRSSTLRPVVFLPFSLSLSLLLPSPLSSSLFWFLFWSDSWFERKAARRINSHVVHVELPAK